LTGAVFAVPGDLATPTGGYGYARRLLAEAGGAGLHLHHIALPDGFPHPSTAALAETERRLAGGTAGCPILVDGLALGVLPPTMLRALPGPVVALCHHPLALETGVDPDRAADLRAVERAALAASAHVITTSATTAAILAADYAVPADRLTVAPPGTDAAPRATGSGGPGTAILSVGSLTPRKGHDVLIAALGGLTHLDWSLTIAGPADRDAAHSAEIERLIARHELQSRVLLAGALDRIALDDAFARADLFVLASRYEGFGMVYTEAMAHGLPVLGTTAGAIPEATRGAACLVPPDDPAALGDSLARLIADPAQRGELADSCWQAAQSFTRWSDTARSVAGVLAGLRR